MPVLSRVRLSPADRQWAEDVARCEAENIARWRLQTRQHADPRGDPYQKRRGALGEVAMYRMLGWEPLTPAEQAAKFKRAPDVGPFQVKCVKAHWCDLLLHEGDDHAAGQYFALVYVDAEGIEAEGLGWLPIADAWYRKRWNDRLPTPTWAVSPVLLNRWDTIPEDPW